MEGTGIKALEEMALKGIEKEIEGIQYGVRELKPLIYDPEPEKMTVLSLTGFVDYIEANCDKLDLSKYMILIQDETAVGLIGTMRARTRKRDAIIQASYEPTHRLPFDEFLPIENFIIWLNSRFVPDDEVAKVLAFLSSVSQTAENQIIDKGVAQETHLRQGVAGNLMDPNFTQVPKRPVLRPFRTFSEIEQPASEFMLRLRGGEEGPRAALFEADDGMWKQTARLSIKAYLADKFPDITILA